MTALRNLLIALALAAPCHAAPARPDIVVFLSDDHTWRDSSVYGAPDIATPNMRRLAADGMTFDQAYVASPSCAPSRAALLTGLYPARNGAEANHSRPRADVRKLPAYLQQLGYEVVAFGKVGHYAQTAEYGFDLARHFNYHEDIAIPKALEWLAARQSDRPLCLFVGSNWPHVPWPADHPDIDPATLRVPPNQIDNPTTREWRARYLAAIRTMDDELGKVYDLARRKLGDDTFFLHTSDNGAQWPFGKWTLYDDGIRTPMIVSWLGHVAPGTRTDAMVSWIDILPTLVDVAGGTPPGAIDGRSFLPVLAGKADRHRDLIFTTHSGDGNFNVYPIRAARSPDGLHYIRNLHPEFRFTSHVTMAHADSGYWTSWLDSAAASPAAAQTVRRYQQRPAEELYATDGDPYQSDNRAADPAQAEPLQRLREATDRWLKETGDPQTVFGEPRLLAAKDGAPRPNIITVLIDDMGWSDLSCFGGKGATTTNIDRLATEGIRFTSFYVNSPICSPSRTALTTGQYPQRWRIGSYLDNRAANRRRGVAQWLDPKAPVLARQLRQAGYATGHFGKWHMGGQRDVGDAPLIQAYGFDRSLTNFEGLGPRVLPLCDAYDGTPARKHDLGSAALGKGPVTWQDRATITSAYVDAALRFIDHAGATGQPFFLNLWPDDVHSPFFPPKDLRAATDGSKRALYHAVLGALDRQLGPLFDRVRNDPKLRDNTLIVLCSDNGPEPGAGSAASLRGSKGWLYEGGIRSPLIVWGPGLQAKDTAGTTNSTAVLCALDLNRSLYQVCSAPLPAGAALDGENVADTLLGKTPAGRKQPVFWRRPPDRPGEPTQDNPDFAVRDGKWKLCVNHDRSAPQLYDLEDDPAEQHNLADRHPEVVARLRQAVLDWNAPLPADAGDPGFRPEPKPAAAPVAAAMTRAEIEAGLASRDRALFIQEGWIRDPYIVLGPDDRYYLTGTTPAPGDPREASDPYNIGLGQQSIVGDAVQVWRSKDLVDWEPLGAPFTLKDGFHAQPGKFVWAPELHWLGDRWALVHCPGPKANLALTSGPELKPPWSHPMGPRLGPKHDPSLFRDTDGSWWMLWQNTLVAPLAADFASFTAEPVRIDPAGSRPGPEGKPISRIGHEGATMRRVGTKYVHFGTAWSTDLGRKGSYNLYYCTADKVTGPYGPRCFAGRFLGHGTPFQTRDGKWWCTAFFNANVPPLPREGIATRDLSADAQTINQRGTTIVPLDVRVLDNGDVRIRAADPAYATPGPDEAQKFPG